VDVVVFFSWTSFSLVLKLNSTERWQRLRRAKYLFKRFINCVLLHVSAVAQMMHLLYVT
jgi:hypothetical protein